MNTAELLHRREFRYYCKIVAFANLCFFFTFLIIFFIFGHFSISQEKFRSKASQSEIKSEGKRKMPSPFFIFFSSSFFHIIWIIGRFSLFIYFVVFFIKISTKDTQILLNHENKALFLKILRSRPFLNSKTPIGLLFWVEKHCMINAIT